MATSASETAGITLDWSVVNKNATKHFVTRQVNSSHSIHHVNTRTNEYNEHSAHHITTLFDIIHIATTHGAIVATFPTIVASGVARFCCEEGQR